MYISRVFTYPPEPFGFNQFKQHYLYVDFYEISTSLNISRPFSLGLIPYTLSKDELLISWGGIINLDRISQQYYLK